VEEIPYLEKNHSDPLINLGSFERKFVVLMNSSSRFFGVWKDMSYLH